MRLFYSWKVALVALILFVILMFGVISFADISGEEINQKSAEQVVFVE